MFIKENEIINVYLKNSFVESNEVKFSDYKEIYGIIYAQES